MAMTWKDKIEEESFIDNGKLERLLETTRNTTREEFDKVLKKASKQEELSLEEVALLINTEEKDRIEEIYTLASSIKKEVYGDRVVLFAPLYLGNKCTNSCKYCGFKVENQVSRQTLTKDEVRKEIEAMVTKGHKRTIMVYGTHPDYSPEYIRDTVKEAYKVCRGGEMRRININAAPQNVEGYKTIIEAEIGTYQIFQETYHKPTYEKVHPRGEKGNFKWRLFGLDRAMEAGLDDVGIGVLFGLYDWKFEVMGLMEHVRHLETKYNVGPHTISFPRLTEAVGQERDMDYLVKDEELKRIIAILRLAVPYTGLILTARENSDLRKECMDLGVSQIDAGTQIELQGYSKSEKEQDLEREQFKIGDERSLEEIMEELMLGGFVPSFCTACYRLGRTGEHFMEFSKPGFIHEFCSPNAMLTLAEYLEDYGSDKSRKIGYDLITKELEKSRIPQEKKEDVKVKLKEIKDGKRDLYY